MGIVAEHIKKKQDIRTKGLLIWLDKKSDLLYCEKPETLIRKTK